MKSKSIKVYACGVDFQHELGDASSNVVYGSVKDLKRKRSCWKGCGIVELKISLSKWVEKQDRQEMIKDAIPSKDVIKYQIAETKERIGKLTKFLEELEKENV